MKVNAVSLLVAGVVALALPACSSSAPVSGSAVTVAAVSTATPSGSPRSAQPSEASSPIATPAEPLGVTLAGPAPDGHRTAEQVAAGWIVAYATQDHADGAASWVPRVKDLSTPNFYAELTQAAEAQQAPPASGIQVVSSTATITGTQTLPGVNAHTQTPSGPADSINQAIVVVTYSVSVLTNDQIWHTMTGLQRNCQLILLSAGWLVNAVGDSAG